MAYEEINLSKRTKFEDLGLSLDLLRGIYSKGWEYPSDIQVKGIPAIKQGLDVILQAQSGVGKTGCFSIGLLNVIKPDEATVQGMVISHTRELAQQTYEVICSIASSMQVNVMLYIGGQGLGNRIKSALEFPDRATIFVGTPGKISDILLNRLFKTQPLQISTLIIDEFDELLKANFRDSMKPIVQSIISTGQIILCSATRNDEIDQFVKNCMIDRSKSEPIEISIKNEEVSLEGIGQYYVKILDDDGYYFPTHEKVNTMKFNTIMDLFSYFTSGQTIVFVNEKKIIPFLEKKFSQENFSVGIISGDMTQEERNIVIGKFRTNNSRILISTGIMNRGIDVNTVSLVINYDLPKDSSDYIHRIGRTGRYGKKGLAISLITTNKDDNIIKEIEDKYRITIEDLPDPNTLNKLYS